MLHNATIVVSAVNLYGQSGRGKRPQSRKRAKRTQYDPINDRAKLVADTMYERAKLIANAIAPDVPADSEPLDDFQTWMILESVAMNLSPVAWDEPDAIADLIRLRKQFGGGMLDTERLKAFKRLQETDARMIPDPDITPQSPEWKEQQKRLGLS